MNATKPQTNYTLVIPANSFVNANNEPNAEIRYQFTTVRYSNVKIEDMVTDDFFWWNEELFDLGNGQYRYFHLQDDGVYDCIVDKNGMISQKKLFDKESDLSKGVDACQLENGDYIIRYAAKYFYRYKTNGSVEYIGKRADLSGGKLFAMGNKAVSYHGQVDYEYRYLEIGEDNTITLKKAWNAEYETSYAYSCVFEQENGNFVVMPCEPDKKILVMDKNQNILRTYQSPCLTDMICYAREYDNQLMILCQGDDGFVVKAHYLSQDGTVMKTDTVKEFTDMQGNRSLARNTFEVHPYETGFVLLYGTLYVTEVVVESDGSGRESGDSYTVVEFYDNSCNLLNSYTFTNEEYSASSGIDSNDMKDVLVFPNGMSVVIGDGKAYIFN